MRFVLLYSFAGDFVRWDIKKVTIIKEKEETFKLSHIIFKTNAKCCEHQNKDREK